VTHFLNAVNIDGLNIIDVCMSGANQTFSSNVEINSLALAHHGARVGQFMVTKWLEDGDRFYLDDENQIDDLSIQVIFTPGHTPDSLALYYKLGEKRLFVGDTLYPFTAVHLDCLGSDVNDYKNTIAKLNGFIATIQNDVATADIVLAENDPVGVEVEAIDTTTTVNISAYQDQIAMFKEFVGGPINFNVEGLMEMCNGDVENAANFFFMNGDMLAQMFPLRPSGSTMNNNTSKVESSSPYAMPFVPYMGEIRLSCGHVEANLTPDSLTSISSALELIEQGFIIPSHIDSGYGEYTVENFTIMLPLKKH